MADEDDLYDDMKDTKLAAKLPSKQRRTSKSEHPLSLTEQVQALQQRVNELEKENSTLQRNMGTLYRTAVAELKRKDALISSLQEQLDATEQENAEN